MEKSQLLATPNNLSLMGMETTRHQHFLHLPYTHTPQFMKNQAPLPDLISRRPTIHPDIQAEAKGSTLMLVLVSNDLRRSIHLPTHYYLSSTNISVVGNTTMSKKKAKAILLWSLHCNGGSQAINIINRLIMWHIRKYRKKTRV